MSDKPKPKAVEVRELAKTFFIGFRRKRVEAVRGVSFAVEAGEVFGLIGPNGAGKTTTIKMIMSLIAPSAGAIEVFGAAVPSKSSRARVGYLPEISYYYDYLKPEEILDFYARLYGLDRSTRKRRIGELLERVGLAEAKHKPLRKFSKGMLQRVGLAQALIADPELIILDEPQSGLDPLGRKEVADLIRELKEQGKTIFFSSHILSDVERICDRVAVMMRGKIVDVGPLSKLLNPRTLSTEIVTPRLNDDQIAAIAALIEPESWHHHDEETRFELKDEAAVEPLLQQLHALDVQLISLTPRRESLEDVFVREAHLADAQAQTQDEEAH